MTKTKIKVVDGKKNKKTVGELDVDSVFEYSGENMIKIGNVDTNGFVRCFYLEEKYVDVIPHEEVPETVYRKMKVKLYE